jgi:preprotein translocase subunit SecA
MDEAWKEHLRELDELKQSVQNATYEQKDPLLIYKFESFELFKTMVETVNREIVSLLLKGQIPISEPGQVQKAQAPKRMDLSNMQTKHDEYGGGNGQPGKREEQRAQPVRVEKKIGRNEPCPCGSGKKYKSCHGVGMD